MAFYCSIKTEFGEEAYLQLPRRPQRVNIAKLRSSSHDLLIEKGRYTKGINNKVPRACRFCCNTDILEGLVELPCSQDPIIESEEHALTECPGYHHLRTNLSENLKSLLLLKSYGTIMQSYHLPEFGKYLTDCFHLRNPKLATAT